MEWVPSEVYELKKNVCAHISKDTLYGMNMYLPLSYLSNLPLFSELETKLARWSSIVFLKPGFLLFYDA